MESKEMGEKKKIEFHWKKFPIFRCTVIRYKNRRKMIKFAVCIFKKILNPYFFNSLIEKKKRKEKVAKTFHYLRYVFIKMLNTLLSQNDFSSLAKPQVF